MADFNPWVNPKTKMTNDQEWAAKLNATLPYVTDRFWDAAQTRAVSPQVNGPLMSDRIAQWEAITNSRTSPMAELADVAGDAEGAKQTSIKIEKTKKGPVITATETQNVTAPTGGAVETPKIDSNELADLKRRLGEYEGKGADINLAPLLALTDSWTGSQLLRGYQPPETQEERDRNALGLRMRIGEKEAEQKVVAARLAQAAQDAAQEQAMQNERMKLAWANAQRDEADAKNRLALGWANLEQDKRRSEWQEGVARERAAGSPAKGSNDATKQWNALFSANKESIATLADLTGQAQSEQTGGEYISRQYDGKDYQRYVPAIQSHLMKAAVKKSQETGRSVGEVMPELLAGALNRYNQPQPGK